MNRKSVDVSITAMTAALYIVLGYVFLPISFLGIQFRVAEVMVGICILFPVAGLIGNLIGVFFVNLSSPLGAIDLLAVFVNIPALGCIVATRKYRYGKYLGGIAYATIISLYVAWLLWFVLGLPFWLMFIQVLISEIILATIGIKMFDYIGRQIDLIDYPPE